MMESKYYHRIVSQGNLKELSFQKGKSFRTSIPTFNKSFILLYSSILLCTHFANAQLNTGGAPYLTTIAAATYLGSSSPYAVPKKVAQLNDSLFESVTDKKYETTVYKGYEYAVYTNKRGKHKAYQILISNDNFTLFCQHYAAKDCDCFEGLSIAGTNDERPIIVRQLLPFSLKANLVERINTYSETKLDPDDFEKVSDIIEYLQTQ